MLPEAAVPLYMRRKSQHGLWAHQVQVFAALRPCFRVRSEGSWVWELNPHGVRVNNSMVLGIAP